MKENDAQKLQDEYAKLVRGLHDAGEENDPEDDLLANPGPSFDLAEHLPPLPLRLHSSLVSSSSDADELLKWLSAVWLCVYSIE
jgi:DNA excision repair protein ERCC-2